MDPTVPAASCPWKNGRGLPYQRFSFVKQFQICSNACCSLVQSCKVKQKVLAKFLLKSPNLEPAKIHLASWTYTARSYLNEIFWDASAFLRFRSASLVEGGADHRSIQISNLHKLNERRVASRRKELELCVFNIFLDPVSTKETLYGSLNDPS